MNKVNIWSLFLLVCVPTRICYAYILNRYKYLWPISVAIGVNFLVKYSNWRGERGAFGGVLWWNNLRLVHGFTYILSAIYPSVLYLDVLIGIIAKSLNVVKEK